MKPSLGGGRPVTRQQGKEIRLVTQHGAVRRPHKLQDGVNKVLMFSLLQRFRGCAL